MARPLIAKHRTRIQIPKDARRNMTFEHFDRLLEMIREVAFVEVTKNNDGIPTSLLVEFETDDLYDLAMRVRDLEDMFNSWDSYSWTIDRPEPV